MLKKIFTGLILTLNLLHAKESPFFITEDFQKGSRFSLENQLPIVLIFTGSDWSAESEHLINEWLFHPTEGEMLRHDCMIVWVDIPELNLKSQNLIEQDYELVHRFQVTSFPTIVLLDPGGREITRLGYPLESLASLIKERLDLYADLTHQWEEVKKSQDETLLYSCYLEAQTLRCEHLLREMKALALEHQICASLLFERYIELVNAGEKNKPETRQLRQILLRRDPNNKQGMRERLALFDFQQQNNAFPLENVLQQFCSHDSENFWKIHLVLAEHFREKGKEAEALEHAQVSYRYAPSEHKEDVSTLIDSINPR